MKDSIQKLYAAQSTLLRLPSSAPEHQVAVAGLRESVANPILAHYLRLVEQGSKGVAPVRNGICSSCHMRIPSGDVGALKRGADLVLCESCGVYLFIPDSEAQPAAAAKPKAVRRRKRTEAAGSASPLAVPVTVAPAIEAPLASAASTTPAPLA